MAALARFRGDRRRPRRFPRESATISRKARSFGPGFDLKRGRGGIREVEFFTQIQQMIHGGRDPSVRAPATLDALGGAGLAAGRLDARTPQRSGRRLPPAAHRSSIACRWSRTRRPTCCRPTPTRSTMSRGCTGSTTAPSCSSCLRPHVERAGRNVRRPRAGARAGACRTIPISCSTSCGVRLSPIPTAAARHVADWRSGKARSLRSPAAQQRVRGDAARPAARRSPPAPTRSARSTASRDIVERLSSGVNLFRLLEARPKLARLLAKDPRPRPGAGRPARPPAGAARGPVRRVELRPAAGGRGIRGRSSPRRWRGQPYDVALDRARRLVNERRFALGVQLIDRRRDPLEVAAGYARVAEGALPRWPRRGRRVRETRTAASRGGELVILGLGRLRRLRADPRVRPRPHLPAHGATGRARRTGRSRSARNDYFNRLASRVTAALSVPTAAGPLYDVDTRLRPEGAKGMLAVSLERVRALPARGGLDLGAYGAVPRAAGVRLGRSPRRSRRR